jgi:hypothetical protein
LSGEASPVAMLRRLAERAQAFYFRRRRLSLAA